MKSYPMMTHPIAIRLRSVLRATGIVRLLRPLLKGREYEEAFSQALLSDIRPGDVVWDVGANIGYYTTQIATLAGFNGRVFAFEPSPRNFPKLQLACRALANVDLEMLALGSEAGRLPFRLSEEESGVTDSLYLGATADADQALVHVDVTTADTFISSGSGKAPDVVKIDVEGFENEVLEGMKQTLLSRKIRSLFVEVHFAPLASRGLADAPRVMERDLSSAGYDVTWLDHSHLVARLRQSSAG